MKAISEVLAERKKAKKPQKSSPLIDFYPNAEARSPAASTTIEDLLDAIKSDEYAKQVAKVRDFIQASDKASADSWKRMLPAVSISGTISDGMRKQAVQEGRFIHSGYIQLDIDGKDNPDIKLDLIAKTLQADQRIVAVFQSPSGTGIKGIARILPDASKHKESFFAVEEHFKSLGIAMDKATKDPGRLCFVTHDPNAFIDLTRTDYFEPLDQSLDEFKVQAHAQSAGLILSANTESELTLDDLRDMIANIQRPGYQEWLEICSGAWNHFGEDATAVLQAQWAEEQVGEYAEKFRNRLQQFTVGTVWHFAVQHGWSPIKVKGRIATSNSIKAALVQAPAATSGSTQICYSPADLFYDQPSGRYLIKVEDAFHSHSKIRPIVTGITRYLAPQYTKPDDLKMAVQSAIASRELDGGVQWTGAMAGKRIGIMRDHSGLPILITSQGRPPTPEAGEFSLIAEILNTGLGNNEDALMVFVSWLAGRYRAVIGGEHIPSPMMVLAGEVNSGKSLLAWIVGQVLGGRISNPYAAWSGGTLWNDNLVGSELLLVDDCVGSTEIKTRRNFGAAFKEAIYPPVIELRKRNNSSISCRPVWAVMVCCNDTPEALNIIPPLDSDLSDKVVLLHVAKIKPHVDTSTPEGRRQYQKMLETELPAFVAMLDEWETPDHLKDSRSGVKAWRDHELMRELDATSPTKRLLDLLIVSTQNLGVWHDLNREFTASEIESRMLDQDGTVRDQARALFSWYGACGSYLAKLSKVPGSGVVLGSRDEHTKINRYLLRF